MKLIARIIKPLLGISVLLVLLILATGWGALKLSLPKLDGSVQVEDLNHDVKIYRDDNGVPDIQSSDRASAFYALGFLHSQERFFQMDLLRRSASGELSELIGKSGLKIDRQRRLWLLRQQAKRQLDKLPPTQRELMSSYTSGVNAGLEGLQSRPFEYWILRTEPQKWKTEDSLLVIAAMYFDLQGHQAGREYMRGWIKENSNPEQTQFLFPTASDWDKPLSGYTPVPPSVPETAPEWWAQSEQGSHATASGMDEGMKGSNGWLIQRDGKAYLANDMHLGLSLPGIWYKAKLEYGEQNEQRQLTGVTLPGVPFMVSGYNGHVAWGLTNSYVDTFDWIKLPSSQNSFKEHNETLFVNHGKPEELTVRESEWGPAVYTPLGDMAMRWAIQLPDSLNLNFLDLDKALSVYDVVATANHSGIPAQNILVADSQGNIAWTLAGLLPDRTLKGIQDSFPIDTEQNIGWNSTPLAQEKYPAQINPVSGMIVSANNRMLFEQEGQYLGDGGADMGVRATAITSKLEQLTDVSSDTLYQVQLDNTAMLAQSWKVWLMRSLEHTKTHSELDIEHLQTLLEEWDGKADKDSVAYALLSTWRKNVYEKLFSGIDEQLSQQWPGAIYRRANPRWDATVQALMFNNKWVPGSYENWHLFTLDTLKRSWQEIGNGSMVWGDINKSHYGHPLANALPVVGNWLKVPSSPLSGDNNVIHVNLARFGASESFAISPSEGENALLSLPAGQSGHPLSHWWLNGFEDWVEGKAQLLQPGLKTHELILMAR
ncbi:peptidase S45 [Hahella sp. CCB-MM4]|uniref:penicillin acylase family protein n=1 Tax=Hahella sp. (strain CCB-MM4) TaxID=1926491 RepID=UPI000B9C050C|nr:penicillin acylase family protein [Hahella sp. CCB-MM4]OZG70434.1 peptidase S45 [Hahella sp. CCB-MM4]